MFPRWRKSYSRKCADEVDLIDEVNEELLEVVINSIQDDDDSRGADTVVTLVDERGSIDDPELLQLLPEQASGSASNPRAGQLRAGRAR